LLLRYTDAIERSAALSPQPRGFAGPTCVPPPSTPYQGGVALSGVLFFWRRAETCDTIPWSVTANMMTRRCAERYDLAFPKTGGGEDIDYWLRVGSGAPLVSVPDAVAAHPWWRNGRRDNLHFFGWARGDGHLVDKFARHTFRSWLNAVELCALWLLVGAAVAVGGSWINVTQWCASLASMLGACAVHTVWLCMFGDKRGMHRDTFPGGARRVGAALEAALVLLCIECGHVFGHVERRRPWQLGNRFDWFIGSWPEFVAKKRAEDASEALRTIASGAIAWIAVGSVLG
jgi:hypothetical protein